MIGYPLALVKTNVLDPQADEARGELRVVLDPDNAPLDTGAQELDVIGITTAPVEGTYEIGGGVEVRHTITVALSVEHGDAAEATRLRDAIVTDLVLRLYTAHAAISGAAPDPTTGQYVTRVTWAVNYLPLELGGDTPNEYATLTFTVDCQLDR